jgi:predicted nucleic acid-binding protein
MGAAIRCRATEVAMIPVADGLIAATAIRHGLHVVTHSTPHFEAAGALVVNPWFCPVTAMR